MSDLKDVYSPTELYRNEKSIDPDGTYEILDTIQSFTPHELKSVGYLARQIITIDALSYPDIFGILLNISIYFLIFTLNQLQFIYDYLFIIIILVFIVLCHFKHCFMLCLPFIYA